MSITKRVSIAEIDLEDQPAATFIQDIYKHVPVEYLNTVELEFYSNCNSVEVYITRPETKEEENRRIRDEIDNKQWNEKNDKEELIELIKKYGIPDEFKNG